MPTRAAQLQPVERRSLSDQVFEQVAREILDGGLAPGVALPPERQLVDQLGVNRGAVREALKRLAQAGLVEIRHGGKTRVLDYQRSAGLDLLTELLLRDGAPDLRVARSVMEMRAALAPDVARTCARRADAALASALHDAAAAIANATQPEVRQQLALEFWDVLVAGSDNVAYRLAFNTLRRTYDRLRLQLLPALRDELDAVDDYRAIRRAVAAKDEGAAFSAAERLVARGTQGVLRIIEMFGHEVRA